MGTNEEFIKEIDGYSIEELELIYETQKDLYTEEEMSLIKKHLEQCKKTEKEKLEKMLPKEINCSKCDGPNAFENNNCVFCGAKLNKNKYYTLDYYDKNGGKENSKKDFDIFSYVMSFLIPLVGYILGSILLSKDNPDEKSMGKTCITLGFVSIIVYALIYGIFIGSTF